MIMRRLVSVSIAAAFLYGSAMAPTWAGTPTVGYEDQSREYLDAYREYLAAKFTHATDVTEKEQAYRAAFSRYQAFLATAAGGSAATAGLASGSAGTISGVVSAGSATVPVAMAAPAAIGGVVVVPPGATVSFSASGSTINAEALVASGTGIASPGIGR